MEWWDAPEDFLVNSEVLNISDFNNTNVFLMAILITDNLSSLVEVKIAETLVVAVS